MKSLLAALAVLLGIIGTATADPFGWGVNTFGEIGDGTSSTNRHTPVAVDVTGVLAGKTITAMSSYQHTLCLTSDGMVYAWGKNKAGALGNGTMTDSAVPVAVDTTGTLSGKIITAIAAGEYFSLVLASDGTMYSWGSNIYGQLGNNTSYSYSLTPVAVDMSGALLGKTVVAISASTNHAGCLTSDGQVFTWGFGKSLGIGVVSSSHSEPAPISVDTSGALSGKFITALSFGFDVSYVLDSHGHVYSWGSNRFAELGAGLTSTWEYSPVAVDRSSALSGKTITAISPGWAHCLVLSTSGELFTWGENNTTDGVLGDGTTVPYALVPVAVDMSGALSGKTITTIAAGFRSSQVLTSDGEVYGWGNNGYGFIGNGSGISEPLPTAVDMSGVLAGMVATDLLSGCYAFHILASPSTSSVPLASRSTYAANFGWLNWRWSGTAAEAPAVDSYILAGKVYAANVGWIDLGDGTPTDSIRYSQSGSDIGVNHDGAGALSGYAYGANIGWVTFDATIAQPPRINISTGDLSGYAYSANCGWIQLGGLKTKILIGADRDGGLGAGDGIADAWELELGNLAGYANGSSLLGVSLNSDFDGDGVSDTAEYLADTNPFAADDALKVTHFSYVPATGEVDLDWTGSQRRSYTVYRSSDMVNWTKAIPPLSGSSADFVLDGPAQPRLFFRVGADLPLR